MKSNSFYLVTDTHFFAPTLGASGEAYEHYMEKEQMTLAENSAIAKATFDKIIEDTETEVVLLPGDLSKNGEKASHLAFVAELNRLKAAGKRVYVITARHDFNPSPVEYVGAERRTIEGTTREELRELYNDFGFSQALEVDERTMSYVAEIFPKVRLLALNSDGKLDGSDKGSFDAELLSWIKAQAQKAKEDGCTVFAMNHYPMIPGVPVFSLVGDTKMRDWQNVCDFLADNGVNLVFTGHMHNQSINHRTSAKGNPFTDICTSALVGYPAQYRKITFVDNCTVDVETIDVPAFDWNMQGLTNKQYFERQFKQSIINRIGGMLSGGEGAVKALKGFAWKLLNRITVGGFGRLLWIRVDKRIKKVPLMDLVTAIVMNIFAGDAPFVEGTPEFDAVRRLLKRFGFVIKKVEKKLGKNGDVDLCKLVFDTLGNNKGYSDNNARVKF